MKKLAVLLVILLFTLAVAVPASADKPETWYEEDFAEDFEVVNCVSFGHPFSVMDHTVGHRSEILYFDRTGEIPRTLFQAQGTDNLYRSTDPIGVYAAAGPFKLSGHVEVISYPPLLVEIKYTGTSWNVHLPDGRTVIHRSGQEVSSFLGEPGSQVLIETIKWTGRTVFDNEAICDAFAE